MNLSQLYQLYKKDFVGCCEDLASLDVHTQRSDYQRCIKEGGLLLRQLDIELCMLGSFRLREEENIKHLRTSFTVCKKKYEEVIGREEAEQRRETVRQPQERQEGENNDKLLECKRLLCSAEADSLNIAANLHDNSNKIIGLTGKTRQVKDYLSRADRVVTQMSLRGQLSSNVVRIVLVAVIVILLIIKFF